MAKILILEDDQNRIQFFKEKLKKHDVYFFDNVEEAKMSIELMGPFDTFFLDHDLDDNIYVKSEEKNTGYQLAKFMHEKKIEAQIIIHSMNPIGAQNMKNLLPTATVIPFSTLRKKL